MALKLVPPAPKPERTRRQALADDLAAVTPSHLLKCPRCSGMEMIETVTGIEVTQAGKHRRGTKTKVCLACLMVGQRIEVR